MSRNHMINPNDFVRVQLTSHGKHMIVKYIDEFNDGIRERTPAATFRAKVPEWDNDGWMRGQFHDVMSYFNESWCCGQNLPFVYLEKCE